MHSGVVLIGGGGHALVVAEAARLAGVAVAGFLDDHEQAVAGRALGLRRVGSIRDVLEGGLVPPRWHLALGDLGVRAQLLDRLGDASGGTTIIHPTAFVSPTAVLGAGVFIGPTAVVHTLARVGAQAIVNTGAIVEHECVIGPNVHLAPNATLGGNCRVGEGALVGIGARMIPGVSVGAGCVVAAGAVVARDVAERARVRGVPAREW